VITTSDRSGVTSSTERLRVIASAPEQASGEHLVDEAAMTATVADGRIRLAALDTVETVGVLLSTSARSTAS
jgi:hypothetical protein